LRNQMIQAPIFDVAGMLIKPTAFLQVLQLDHGLMHDQSKSFLKVTFDHCLAGKAEIIVSAREVEHRAELYTLQRDLAEMAEIYNPAI